MVKLNRSKPGGKAGIDLNSSGAICAKAQFGRDDRGSGEQFFEVVPATASKGKTRFLI